MSGEGCPRSIYHSIFFSYLSEMRFSFEIFFSPLEICGTGVIHRRSAKTRLKIRYPLIIHAEKPTAPIFLFGAAIKKEGGTNWEKREGTPKASFSPNKVYLAFSGMLTGPCGIETFGALSASDPL